MAKIKNQKEKKIEWVDVHNDALMVSLGIHQPNVIPIDPSIYMKTEKELELLRKYRNRFKKTYLSGSMQRQKPIPVYSKLIIRISPSNEYKFIDKNGFEQCKTTFSFDNVCQSDLNNYINKFGNKIIYYVYAGRQYKSNELPFWYK